MQSTSVVDVWREVELIVVVVQAIARIPSHPPKSPDSSCHTRERDEGRSPNLFGYVATGWAACVTRTGAFTGRSVSRAFAVRERIGQRTLGEWSTAGTSLSRGNRNRLSFEQGFSNDRPQQTTDYVTKVTAE